MPAKQASVSSAMSRYCLRPFSASRRNRAAAAVGFPAGVGASCNGLRRADNAPSGNSSRRGRVEESTECRIVEARNHRVGQLDGGMAITHCAARHPRIDAGMDGKGIIIERAGNRLRRRGPLGTIGIGNHVVESRFPIPGFLEQPIESAASQILLRNPCAARARFRSKP